MAAEVPNSGIHPLMRPNQRTLRRRLNNWSIYQTILRAFRDSHAQEPILMAPCGYGWFFDRFQRDKVRIAGIDIDHQTVEYARTAITPAPRIVEGSLLEMPFMDGEFDFIVNNRFMPHFDCDFRAKAFKELARVTRRYVLVHYDHPVSVRQLLRRLRGTRKPKRDVEHIEGWRKTQIEQRKVLFNRAQMEKEGAEAGLRVKGLYFVTPLISDRVYCLYEKI